MKRSYLYTLISRSPFHFIGCNGMIQTVKNLKPNKELGEDEFKNTTLRQLYCRANICFRSASTLLIFAMHEKGGRNHISKIMLAENRRQISLIQALSNLSK
jgi:hypothetical protein